MIFRNLQSIYVNSHENRRAPGGPHAGRSHRPAPGSPGRDARSASILALPAGPVMPLGPLLKCTLLPTDNVYKSGLIGHPRCHWIVRERAISTGLDSRAGASRGSGAGSTRPALAAACLLSLGGGPALAAGDAPLALKLDHRLDLPAAHDDGEPLTIPVAFGIHDLRARIGKVHDGISATDADNRRRAAELARLEGLIDGLRRLAIAQDDTIGALETSIAAAGTPRAAPPPRPAPAPVIAPAPPAGRGVPLDRLAVDGVLGAAVVVLLGWALWLRSGLRRRQFPEPHPAGASGAPDGAAVAAPAPPDPGDARGAAAPGPAARDEDPGTIRLQAPLLAAAAPEPAEQGAVEIRVPPASPSEPDPPPAAAGEDDYSHTVVRRLAADPHALREVDTLIAFENHEQAIRLLEELVKNNPDNPEYRVRLLHLERERGNVTRSDEEEDILSAMMDGPLSDTILRVKEIGRGLLPGHPLFDEEAYAAGRDARSGAEQEVLDRVFAAEPAAGALDAGGDTEPDGIDLRPARRGAP